jgi:hypothetical protein
MPADLVSATVALLVLALLAPYALVARPLVRSLELRLFLTLFDQFVPGSGDGQASGRGKPTSGRGLPGPR